MVKLLYGLVGNTIIYGGMIGIGYYMYWEGSYIAKNTVNVD